MLLPGFSKTLREHKTSLLTLTQWGQRTQQGWGGELWCLRRWHHHSFSTEEYGGFAALRVKPPVLLLIWPRTTCSSKACFGTKWYKSCVILYHSPWSHCYAHSVDVNTWAPLIFLSRGSCTQLLWGEFTPLPLSGEVPALLFAQECCHIQEVPHPPCPSGQWLDWYKLL